jgi:hypothetical protein
MFTWICPKCGREVPPSYTECPTCTAAAAAPAQPVAESPPPPVMMAPPPRRSSGMPAWLMTIVFTLAFVGLGAAVYWGVNYFRGAGAAGPAPVTLETPTAAKGGGKPHPLAKYLEIAGMRFVGDKKKTSAKFLIVNHSGAEITNLAANITIWGRTQRSEEDAVGSISFRIGDIGANEAKEVTAPVTTKLKIYELPDWQNVTTDVQITSPPAQ